MKLFEKIKNREKIPLPVADKQASTTAKSSLFAKVKNHQSKSKLFAKVKKRGEEATPQNIMLKQLNYESMFDPDNTDPKFFDIFEQVHLQMTERGHTFTVHPDKGYTYTQTAKPFSLYRHKPEHIAELVDYIETDYNPKCQIHGRLNLDPPLPSIDDFAINHDAERHTKKMLHCTFDIETNKHQKLYAETYWQKQTVAIDLPDFTHLVNQEPPTLPDFTHQLTINTKADITGGVLGAFFAEGKRYIEFQHVRRVKDKALKIYQDTNGGIHLFMRGTDPLEPLLLVTWENSLAQILLSTMAQSQRDLVTIFQELTTNLHIPINTTLLRACLNHEHTLAFMCHHGRFDMNRIIETRSHHKDKKFNFFIPQLEPKSLPIHYGNSIERLERKSRVFQCVQGQIPGGLKYKVTHNTKYSRDGKVELYIAPYQRDSTYSTFGLDTLVLAKACQLPPGERDLYHLSQNTKYPKLSDKEFSPEQKLFDQEEFHLIEENNQFNLSKQSYYLYRDCLATLAAYGNLTELLSMKDLEDLTGVYMTHTYHNPFPLPNYINSTASLSKEYLFADVQKYLNDLYNRTVSIREIEYNFKLQRNYFQHWNKVLEDIEVYNDETKEHERWVKEHPIFQAGRVITWMYGQIRPKTITLNNRPVSYQIKLLDFASQYPHMARQACSMQMIYLAAQNKLHTKQIIDVKKTEERFWYAINTILKGIHNDGTIPDKTLIYLNGVAKVHLSKGFQVREDAKTIQYPKYQPHKRPKFIKKADKVVKGIKILYLSELAHAVIRKYELKPQWHKLSHTEKIKKLKSQIHFYEGQYLDFNTADVVEHGEETFTKIYEHRKATQKQLLKAALDFLKVKLTATEQKFKTLMNAMFGSTAEGISKSFVGKLLCPPIPASITGFARFCNNLAEIYSRKWGGTPLYSHTDSIALYATNKAIEKVKQLFHLIDPLNEETKPFYQDIDWFIALGKGKYAFHSLKAVEINQDLQTKLTNDEITEEQFTKQKLPEFTFTSAGAGNYGEHLVADSYKDVIQNLYHGKTIAEAVHSAKDKFPHTYSLNYRHTRKDKSKTIHALNTAFKAEPIDIINYNPKLSIYLFSQKNGKTWRKIIAATNNIYYGNFAQYMTIPIPKIDRKKTKEFHTKYKQVADQAKHSPHLRGYSKVKELGTLTEKLQAINYIILNDRLPPNITTVHSPPGLAISYEAIELAQEFDQLTALTAQHLLNYINHRTSDIQTFDFALLDHSLTYYELLAQVDEHTLEQDPNNQDEDYYFNLAIDHLDFQLSEEIITQEEYEAQVDEVYLQYDKTPPYTPIKSKRASQPLFNSCNSIAIHNHSPIDTKDIIDFVIKHSEHITQYEEDMIYKTLQDHPKAKGHLTKRFNFNPEFYKLDIDKQYQELITKELDRRYDSPKKKKQMANSIIGELIFTDKKLDYIELHAKPEQTDGKTNQSIPNPTEDASFKSDGLTWNLSFIIPDHNISEYTVGASNRDVTQCIRNMARTLSCEYARTHAKTKEIIDGVTKYDEDTEQKLHDYLYVKRPEDLPCPKKASIFSENMKGFTVRAKFKAVPIIENIQKDTIISKTTMHTTFGDNYKKWLKQGVITQINENAYLVLDPKPLKAKMGKILNVEWQRFTFQDKKWTVELKDFKSGDSNGMLYCGGVIGKNRTMNCSMRFNPASNKLINFNLFNITKRELFDHSHIVKDLLKKAFHTNTLTAFTRNASQTTEDYKKKKRPTDALDKVYQCFAQVILEEKIEEAVTKPQQFHLTEDIDAKDEETATWTVRTLNYAMQDAYKKRTSSTKDIFEELFMRKKLGIGQSKQGNASAIQNFGKNSAYIAYHKNYNQLINKMKRVFTDSEVPKNVVKNLREHSKDFKNIIRVETQIKSFKSINDPKSYENHAEWIKIVKYAIKLVEQVMKIIKEQDDLPDFTHIVNQEEELLPDLTHVINYEENLMRSIATIIRGTAKLRPLCEKFLDKLWREMSTERAFKRRK